VADVDALRARLDRAEARWAHAQSEQKGQK
jgi:hypothetical protein